MNRLSIYHVEFGIGIISDEAGFYDPDESTINELLKLDFVDRVEEVNLCSDFLVVCKLDSIDEATPERISEIKSKINNIVNK